MKLDEIMEEASKLPEDERASLASQLLHGLKSPIYDISNAEVQRRINGASVDPGVMITVDELIAGLGKQGILLQ